jgi:metallo-beta-lactamase class B
MNVTPFAKSHPRTRRLILACSLMYGACFAHKLDVEPKTTEVKRVDLVKQCEGREGWSDTAPPAHIFGNVYLVGTCGITSILITSDSGHVLIDGATEEAAPFIAENIRALGFDVHDVRYLLNSHEHFDHVGGLAKLKEITGAQLLARAEAKASLESGVTRGIDPQFGSISKFAGVGVDRVITDGEAVTLGPLRITAIASPGHAPGGTSWTWKSCEGSTCYDFVYADSLGAVSADSYKFSEHLDYVVVFQATIDKIASLKSCDILLTPHPSQSDLFERVSGAAPLVDSTACARYAATAKEKLTARLAKETSH